MRKAATMTLILAGLMSLPGCVTTQPIRLPSKDLIEREQLVIHCDFDLPKRHRLLDELTALQIEVLGRLGVPSSDEPVYVYLFEDADRYQRYMVEHHPDFPTRRAFFIKSDTTLRVYAYWGERVADDLRHEVTHAYLHSVVPNLPLWLDEGIAEYYEVGRGNHGINHPHIDLLLKKLDAGEWKPDLPALEELTDVPTMRQLHYAESWLWIHFVLESPGHRAELLREQLRQLRANGESDRLSRLLAHHEPAINEAVLAHLEMLRGLE